MKKYQLTQETQKVFSDYAGMLELRDTYVKLRFLAHRQAARCAKEAEWLRRKFWKMVVKEYPILGDKGGRLTFNTEEGYVIVKKK